MRKYIGLVAAAALAVSLSVGVATAIAGGGNSANAKLCQKGGWMNVQGSDGTQFANQDECVSFGAHGGTIVPKPPCTAGSEDFSEDADGSQPTTFAGGTIDTAYGTDGGVSSGVAGFLGNADFTGFNVNSFQLTFTDAVGSVQLDAEANIFSGTTHLTLTAFDASNAVIGSDTETQPPEAVPVTLSVTSSSDNIKYFTIATDDPLMAGLFFSNIFWGCAT